MNKETEWFGEVRWCDNDLKNALIEAGYLATENNVAELRTRCESHRFADQMIDAGWDYIYNAIFNAYRDGKLEHYELQARPLSQEEKLYISLQSQQISMQTGFIGCLRAEFGGSTGEEFYSAWNIFREDLNTDDFKIEFDSLINSCRFGNGSFLSSRTAMYKFCQEHPEYEYKSNSDYYGVRIDTEQCSYLMRLNLNCEEYDYDLYCYCYRREWFDNHLEASKKGIRFIDPAYNNLFVIPDGGKIKITSDNGESIIHRCRYIDQYHFEVDGSKIYHICEFAEKMQENGNTVELAAKNE